MQFGNIPETLDLNEIPAELAMSQKHLEAISGELSSVTPWSTDSSLTGAQQADYLDNEIRVRKLVVIPLLDAIDHEHPQVVHAAQVALQAAINATRSALVEQGFSPEAATEIAAKHPAAIIAANNLDRLAQFHTAGMRAVNQRAIDRASRSLAQWRGPLKYTAA